MKTLRDRRGSAPIDPVRVRDAERLLEDRACRGGGWNYGNSNMLGQELAAYVPTTAVALLAMRDRAGDPASIQGLEFLERHATSERSALALALASRALRAYGRDAAPCGRAPWSNCRLPSALGNHAAAAAALYALGRVMTLLRILTSAAIAAEWSRRAFLGARLHVAGRGRVPARAVRCAACSRTRRVRRSACTPPATTRSTSRS